MSTHNIQFNYKIRKYPSIVVFLSYRKISVGTQKWVRISHRKRAIGVRAIEVRLYFAALSKNGYIREYDINLKYWDTLISYHTCPKILIYPLVYLLMCLKIAEVVVNSVYSEKATSDQGLHCLHVRSVPIFRVSTVIEMGKLIIPCICKV